MSGEQKDSSNRGPGDVIVSLCNIISTDGKHTTEIDKNMWHSIVLFESMELMEGDFPFIVGEINIVDSAALFNEMRFSGDETIELKFKTPQKEEISFKGRVFKVSAGDVAQLRLIKLKFCSPEKLYSDQIKFNRSYRDVLYSDMARDMFYELGKGGSSPPKTFRIEPSKNKGSVVVNNKSPVEAINMIKKVAKSAEYMGSNYVFYESVDREFQFLSLESLIDPSKKESTMIYYDEVPPPGVMNTDKLKQILDYSIERMPDIMAGTRQGMFSGTVVSNDLLKRQTKYKTFNYDQTYNMYKSVNYNQVSSSKTSLLNNKMYSSRYDSNIMVLPTSYKSHDTETSYGDDRADTFLVRNSQLQQICSIQLKVIVPGDSQRRVGEIVELVLPSRGNYSQSKPDIAFSGRYLITKIKHMISAEEKGYTTIMLLSKDSYGAPLPEGAS